MKRNYLFFMIIFLVVALCGCKIEQSRNDIAHFNEAAPPEATQSDTNEHSSTEDSFFEEDLTENHSSSNITPNRPEPPENDSISFYCVEELEIFLSSPNWCDEDFYDYLEQREIDIPAIQTKQDVTNLKRKLTNVEIPTVSDAELFFIQIMPDRDRIFLMFSHSSGKTLKFDISYGDYSETLTKLLQDTIQDTPTGKIPQFALVSTDLQKGNTRMYREIGNCLVVFWMKGSASEASEILSDILAFTPIVKDHVIE